jgi:RND family efflux transporter MFP subunit
MTPTLSLLSRSRSRSHSRPVPRRRWLAATGALLGLALTAAGCRAPEARASSADEPADRTAVTVSLAPVGRDDRPAPLVVAATLAAKEEVPLAFKIGGIVSRVAVEPGTSVRAGQVLAELADDEIASAVRKAREGREKAERDLARAQALYADSAVTRAQLEDATTGVEVSRADERAALFNRRFAAIVAPAEGLVLRRLAEVGEQVPPGQPVVVLRTSRRGMIARVTLADRERVRVAVGDAATVHFAAADERCCTGRVRVVGLAPSPMTGAYEAEIALDGADALPSGLVGTATIMPTTRGRTTGVPVVPVEALVEADGDSAAVFVVTADDVARRRVVRIGAMVDGLVRVPRGVEPGESVVVAGGPYLVDGARVRRGAAGPARPDDSPMSRVRPERVP